MTLSICILLIIFAYFLGSIPTGYYVYLRKTGEDIRKEKKFGASGSTGGSNAWRLLGWKYGLLIMTLDGLKGAIPMIIATNYFKDNHGIMIGFVAISPILGHTFSCLIPSPKFKAGKSVATFLGVAITVFFYYLPLSWAIGIVGTGLFIWIFLKIILKKKKEGAYIASFAVLAVILFLGSVAWELNNSNSPLLLVFIAIAVIFILFGTHRENWNRLKNSIDSPKSET
jgi:glycerol-3-phosphate acyltransferase PlsY